jgi:hypothetical protein
VARPYLILAHDFRVSVDFSLICDKINIIALLGGSSASLRILEIWSQFQSRFKVLGNLEP